MRLNYSCDMHHRRKTVIAWLAAINIVVRMHCLGADLSTEYLYRTVRDHLVAVHVWLGAWACLPNYEGKVIIQFAVDHLLCCLDYGLC